MNDFFVKIDNKDGLWVRHQFMVDAGVSDYSLRDSKKKNRNWTDNDPSDKRKSIYDFDNMPEKYRNDVKAHLKALKGYEDPYEYMALEPIRNAIVKDIKAEAFYVDYQYLLNGNWRRLNEKQVEQATKDASLLCMLSNYKSDKRKMRKQFKLDWMAFVEQVIRVIKADGYSLPKTYRNLVMERLKEFEQDNYETCLPKGLGNQNTAKVRNDDLTKDMMLELLNHPNQYDDAFIRKTYNEWARKNNKATITTATVRNKRVEYGYELTAGRESWQEHNKIYNRSVQRMKPTQPLFLLESDDNEMDWWFVDDKNEIKKLYSYWVVDSFAGIEYPLGWAFSESPVTIVQVRLAFLMAMMHIKELTGAYYLPHETKTDNWQKKTLKPFYESIGHYAESAFGSKNRGWLENLFGHVDWKRSLKQRPDGYPSNNFTGNNISSKNLGFNQEYLNRMFRGKQLPHIEDSGKWISAHAERLRTLPIGYEEGAKSRQELWLEAWNQLPDSEKRPMTEMQFLMKFGLLHNLNGGNTITKQGVQPTIAGTKYSYAVPPAYYLPNVGKKVQTLYNPFDMSRVLITDGQNLRFMAQHITPVAGCMKDMGEGGRSFLNQILEEKRQDVERVTESQQARKNRLLEAGESVDAVLQLGAMAQKELKGPASLEWQIAKVVGKQNESEAENTQSVSTETDTLRPEDQIRIASSIYSM